MHWLDGLIFACIMGKQILHLLFNKNYTLVCLNCVPEFIALDISEQYWIPVMLLICMTKFCWRFICIQKFKWIIYELYISTFAKTKSLGWLLKTGLTLALSCTFVAKTLTVCILRQPEHVVLQMTSKIVGCPLSVCLVCPQFFLSFSWVVDLFGYFINCWLCLILGLFPWK